MKNQLKQFDTGQLFVSDQFSPEDNAMLQALYSRSDASYTEHSKKVLQAGSGQFMQKYYLGYGHASIADCGSTTLFIEGVSILADKVIQDWPLYSGQETSTRYIDMSTRAIIDPLQTSESKDILSNWMHFYTTSILSLPEFLKTRYPKQPEDNQAVYEKAIKAKAFDIMRGFLPAGITTQLSWHSNLRQLYEKLRLMQHHPLAEVRHIAKQLWVLLSEKYPSSFILNESPEIFRYLEDTSQEQNYFCPDSREIFTFRARHTFNKHDAMKIGKLFQRRPTGINLPVWTNEAGQITFDFLLDYGSFRDLQRHRNGSCRIPLLTTKHGFQSWYLNQLPENLRITAEILINKQVERINNLDTDAVTKQYYTALGFLVPCRVTYNLLSAVYVIELRTQTTVHPTLRRIAALMNDHLKKIIPYIKVHNNPKESDWDIKRGQQDIVAK